jgi:glycosyltransferase involved in cell wall biosynthesis
VTTFHDLFVLTGEYSTAEFRHRFAAQARHAASAADGILAVSAFTAGQVADLLGVERNRIWVVPHGADAPAAVTPPEQREPILLFVGALQKRKNVVRLVDAFRAAPAGWRLVLVGGQGYGAEEILGRIAASPCRDRILLRGYVSGAELQHWYQRAAALVFPSLDEGFGIPVLEAMANGVPVVASQTSALPEVMGDAGLPVDPHRTESIAEGIRRITGDPELRVELAERGRVRARFFTWEKTVEKTWAAYETIAR